MRAVLCVMLLLLAPLASGWTSISTEDDQAPRAKEHLLVLAEGVWDAQGWDTLIQSGIQPLRSVRADALLVWADDARVDWPDGVVVEDSEVATYRPGLQATTWGEHRVLLEPRLPASAVDVVREALVASGAVIRGEALNGGGNLPATFIVDFNHVPTLNLLLEIEGVLWIEPVLESQARNEQAASLMETGALGHHPYWAVGLNGSGVVFGVADSGIDADHTCFRNATSSMSDHAESNATYPAIGTFGDHHRKILHLNASVDGNDTPGHSDYRHGTHVIGSLGCHDVMSARNNSIPANGSTLAYGSKLVVQDIVSSDGWTPPQVDQLLWETSAHGGLIHSNSWGDATTAYTERTGHFDAYAKAMPWSLAFIAPGNAGEGVLEPANGRNVIAVSASTKDIEEGRWGSTSYGPTEAETDGIFLLAPGANIESAGADGFWDTNNANLRLSSGTSMSTPLASSAAGLVQQLYQDGWLVPEYAALTAHNLSDLQPAWAESLDAETVMLGDGFTPSGPLLRASLAMATTPLPESVRNGGEGGHALHNPYDGWGVLNLSELFDPAQLETNRSATPDVWVHDSYRLKSGTVSEWFTNNGGTSGNLSGMLTHPWYGNESTGPFLQTGDVFTHRFTPLEGQDLRIRMAFAAQPEPAMVDDLQLRVRLEDGTMLLADQLREGGFAPTEYYPHVVDSNNTTTFPPTNETVFGINVPWSYLYNSSYVDVDVVARYVQPGGVAGSVGLDGDAVGFAMVVKGVDRDSRDHLDDDGDGVLNKHDGCPNEDSRNEDSDGDGCLDDDDSDGVSNRLDDCPLSERSADVDENGCSPQQLEAAQDEEGVGNFTVVEMYVVAASKTYQEDVSVVAFNHDGSEYASIHAAFCQAKTCDDSPSESVLRFWNTSTMTERLSIPLSDHVVKLDWSPDGSSIALLSAHNTVSIYNRTGEFVHSFSAAPSYAGDLAFDPTGTMLAVVSNYDGEGSGEIEVYNASSGALIQRLEGSTTSTTADGYYYAVDWNSDGSRLLVGGFKTYMEFEVSTWSLSNTVGYVYSYITDIAYSPDESKIAVCSGWARAAPSLTRSGFAPSQVSVYGAVSDGPLWAYTSSSSCIDADWSPNSEFVAFSHSAYTVDGATINVFHGNNGSKAYTLSSQPPGGCADYPADFCAKVTSIAWHPQEAYIISSQSFSDMGIYHWQLEEVIVVTPEPVVLGCTTPTAYNYDPAATEDDGSCGCVDWGDGVCRSGSGYVVDYDPSCTNCYGSPPALLPPLDFSNAYLGPSAEEVFTFCCLPAIFILFMIRSLRRSPSVENDPEKPKQIEQKVSQEAPADVTVGWLDDFDSPDEESL